MDNDIKYIARRCTDLDLLIENIENLKQIYNSESVCSINTKYISDVKFQAIKEFIVTNKDLRNLQESPYYKLYCDLIEIGDTEEIRKDTIDLLEFILVKSDKKVLDNIITKYNLYQPLPVIDKSIACAFTGPRPPGLYGYDYNDCRYDKLLAKLMKCIEQLIVVKGVRYFISGGALGFDTLAFLALDKLKSKYPFIKNYIFVPFKFQYKKWTANDINVYKHMLEKADYVLKVDRTEEYSAGLKYVDEYAGWKMQKRNEAMVDFAKYIITSWDGVSKGGTFNCLNYIKRSPCKRMVFNIDKFDYSVSRLDKSEVWSRDV